FYCYVCMLLCFFFQAEDGIRDDLVTGVQTCALPIFRPGTNLSECLGEAVRLSGFNLQSSDILAVTQKIVSKAEGRMVDLRGIVRSEERRVGKECSFRWSLDPE